MNDFKEGDLIVYVNGSDAEIGKIKSVHEDGAFVWYHEGTTAAKTPFDRMYKLRNDYCVKETTLGGAWFE